MIKKIISMLLIFTMILPLGMTKVHATEVEELQKIRIYNSADQTRHDMDVIIENDKVFVDATQLVSLYDGEVLLGATIGAGYKIISNIDDIYTQYTTGDAREFSLTNNFVDIQLIFDVKNQSWHFFDTAIPSDIERWDLALIDAPIFKNGKIYVDLLPTARFLGAVVNVTKDRDGLILHIPKSSARTVVRDAIFFISGEHGFTVNLDSNIYTESLIFADVFLDCAGGELGSWVTGQYDVNKFKNIIYSIATNEQKPNYVEELWEGYDYTVDFLDTDAGISFIDMAADGYSDYVDYLNMNPEVKNLLDAKNASTETAVNLANAAMGSVIDLYNYNYRIMQLATEKVSLLNNVYVVNNKYLSDEEVSVWGESIEDIVEDIVKDYYNGLSGEDVLRAVVKNTADMAIDILLGGDGLSELMGVNTEQVAALESITPSAALTYCGIMLKEFERQSGYEYGNLKEVDTIREMQTHLRTAFYNTIKHSEYWGKDNLEFLNNCAIMYCELYRAYMGSLDNANDYYLEVYERINNANIADAVMNTFSNREWLSKAKSDELLEIIFVDTSAKVDFHKLKEILGYPSGNGVTYASANGIADFDGDGYPEIHIKLPDERYHSNDIWVIMDLNDGILGTLDWYAHTGPQRTDWRNMDTTFYYDKTAKTYAFKVEEHHGWDGGTSEEFYRWNGSEFERYFMVRDTHKLEKTYLLNYENLPDYKGEDYYKGIVNTYGTEYEVSSGNKLEIGDDMMEYYHKFMKDIEETVKILNKELGLDEGRFYPNDEANRYVRYNTFYYNKDRTLMGVSTTKDYPEHLFENYIQFWDYQVPMFHFNTDNYEIVRKEFPCEYGDDTCVNWEIEHGFEH